MGQQIAFILIIILGVMIFAQVLMIRTDLQKKFDSIYNELSKIKRIIGKVDSN